MPHKKSLANATNFSDIFQIVKKIVQDYVGEDQAGLLVGISDLGNYGQAFLGAFYSMDANTIVINKRPLDTIQRTQPDLYNPYVFHVMLHEYLHSLGILEEDQVRLFAYEISKKYFGSNHLTTQIAFDLERFLPQLSLGTEFEAPEEMNIEFVNGIDKDNTDYIM